MQTVLDVGIAALLLVGCLLNLIAAIGLHRLPDVLCRMHAATKPATLGLLTVLIGAAVAVRTTEAVIKLLLVGALQLATNPVGGHMVGRATWRSGRHILPETRMDADTEQLFSSE